MSDVDDQTPTMNLPSTTSSSHVRGVLVVGGGYAGLHAARAAARVGVPVTVLAPTPRHDFVTRLAAVAGGVADVGDASCDLDFFDHDVMVATMTGVGDGEVELLDGRTVTADAVVVCAGAKATVPPIEGIEHALVLRSAADALAIRAALGTADAVIVIGGGPTGVQLAGAVSAVHDDVEVHLVESSERLVPGMSESLASGVTRILGDRGVHVHVSTEVERVTANGADIDGEHVEGIVVWAGGFAARTDELGVDVNGEGRILVDDHLRVVGFDRTFAAGDVTAHLDPDGQFHPMSAQIAVQAGTAAGRNAARLINGDELDAPTLRQRGWVLDLSGRRGVAEFGPVTLGSAFADLIPPVVHWLIDVKTLVGMGGLRAARCLAP